MEKLEYTSISLEFRTPGATQDVECKFSDLQETLEGIDWSLVNTMTIRKIPVFRDPKFEDAVTRYVFNQQQAWDLVRENRQYEYLIFGE